MKYNAVLDVSFSSENATEPVTLAEAKEWLILSDEITDDDTLITKIIKASRIRLERATNVSFITRTVTAHLLNQLGDQELPYGPITSFTSLKDQADAVIDTDLYSVVGASFKQLKTKFCDPVIATYVTGYASLPADMREDLLNQIAYAYENRGDVPTASKLSPLLNLAYSHKNI